MINGFKMYWDFTYRPIIKSVQNNNDQKIDKTKIKKGCVNVTH